MGYIPDFLFPRAKLIVEADGWRHFTTAGKRADARRTSILAREGYFVLRFRNKEITDFPEQTLETIKELWRARLDRDVGLPKGMQVQAHLLDPQERIDVLAPDQSTPMNLPDRM